MLDFICMGCEKREASDEIQYENICLYRESKQRPLAFQVGALKTL